MRTPQRAAIAVKWMSAFVDPPIACKTISALLNAFALRMSRAREPPLASAAARRPDASASRNRSAWTAGIAAAPGNVIPSTSATQAIVLAVPITMQVPAVGASRSLTASTSRCSISPPR